MLKKDELEKVEFISVVKRIDDLTLCNVKTLDAKRTEYQIWINNDELKGIL